MTVLSVDLASRRYRDNGIALLSGNWGDVGVERVRPESLGLSDPPEPSAYARALHDLATARQARLILLDGPQGWRAERSELVHQRRCEQATRAPGKTGLPGIVKPATWTRMAEFSIAVFDALDALGWPRIHSRWDGARASLESFPTQGWRSLGLPALPSAAKVTSLQPWRSHLHALGVHGIPDDVSHDELQAVVAGLAGLQLLAGGVARADARGCDPLQEGGLWREGWIVCPRL